MPNVESILSKLPQVWGWIEATLKAHEGQSQPVTSYGFERLPQFYSPDLLAFRQVAGLSDRIKPDQTKSNQFLVRRRSFTPTFWSGPDHAHGLSS